MAVKCNFCGKVHEDLPLDLAYLRPASFFGVPEIERPQRIQMTEDVCVIDRSKFIIRGVLPMPIRQSQQQFQWGTWALVDAQSFRRYLELWDEPDVENEPPLRGYLDGGLRAYSNSDHLPVQITLRSDHQRPLFIAAAEDHPVAIAQRDGITLKDVHRFVMDLV